MTMATSPATDPGSGIRMSSEPVYLGYNELRQSVRATEPRPTAPEPMSFIEIPGNTELAIRDGILYADSYVDLVAIDLASFGDGPGGVARQPDILPWDAYQNVPEGTYFDREPDSTLGVVIGAEERR